MSPYYCVGLWRIRNAPTTATNAPATDPAICLNPNAVAALPSPITSAPADTISIANPSSNAAIPNVRLFFTYTPTTVS